MRDYVRSLRQLWNRRPQPRPRPRCRLDVECLEDRLVPTTFNVNSLADFSISGGVNPNGTIIGRGNIITLRSAIQAANATPGGNTINLALPGTYKITLPGAGEDNNQTGDFDILPSGGNLTIQNTSGGTVVVDGNRLDRVFDVNPNDTFDPATKITATLVGFTIQNGIAAPGDGPGGSGGGIRDQGNASLTLTNMVLSNNIATADGGGVSMENPAMNAGDHGSTPWTLTLNNTTVTHNHAGDAGGGIETDGKGKVFVNTGSVISGNTTQNQGGGIWLDAVEGGVDTVTVTNMGTGYTTAPIVTFNTPNNGTAATGIAVIDGNGHVTSVIITSSGFGYTAPPLISFGGPGMNAAATGTIANQSATLVVTDTLIANNTALTVDGGIGNAGNSLVTINTCTLENNFSVTDGGGFGDTNGLGSLIVTNSYFLNNAAGGHGGAIQEGGPTTTITNSEFRGNSAGNSGGALFANGVTLLVTSSTFVDNTSTGAPNGGGAIELATSGTGANQSIITNCTITGNRAVNNAGTDGGGIDFTGIGNLLLLNDTITLNFADVGGGIYWNSTNLLQVQNTIVALNTASGAGPDAFNGTGAFTDLGGNLIGISGAGSGNTGFTNMTTQRGSVANPLDPLLGSLQFNGGPMVGATGAAVGLGTQAELTGSTAIDTGVAAGAPNVDERGFPRPDFQVGELPDIGAFEFQQQMAPFLVGSGVKDVSIAFDSMGRQVTAVVYTDGSLYIFDTGGAHFIGSFVQSASIAFNAQGQQIIDVVFTNNLLYSFDTNGAHFIGSGVLSVGIAFDGMGNQVTDVVYAGGALYEFNSAGFRLVTTNVVAVSLGFNRQGQEVQDLVYSDGTLFQFDANGATQLGSGVNAVGLAFNGVGREVLDLVFASTQLWQYLI